MTLQPKYYMSSKIIIVFLFVGSFVFISSFGSVSAQTFNDSPSDFFISKNIGRDPMMMAPGLISSGMDECGGSMGKDGDEFYFCLRQNGTFSVIMGIRFEDGFWSHPEVLSFSGTDMDASPFLSPDGRFLYFASDRPENIDDGIANWNFWRSSRNRNGNWLEPELMPFSSPGGNELSVTMDTLGNVYFCADYEGQTITLEKDHLDIYHVSVSDDGEWGEVVKLGPEINTAAVEQTPSVSPDGKCLVFSSLRVDGEGTADLYVSHKENGKWTSAENLKTPVNSFAYEYAPVFSSDGRILFFTSSRKTKLPGKLTYSRLKKWLLGPGNGSGDIWYVKASSICERD
jgi:hypothetical protein